MELSGKRLLVTGGAGFLGTHLVAKLQALEPAAVVVPRSRSCDLVDRQAVEQLFRETRPDVVFHLAARVGGIGANQANPGLYFHDNLVMGTNIIEQARVHRVAKVVLTGTICSYPKYTPIPFREEELWNGYPEETNAPYGVAKKALIVMAQAYRQQYGLNTVVALPVNLYGPQDNFDLETSHVIPALIRKCVEATARGQDEVALWGNGEPTREFLYVNDCADGLVRMAQLCEHSEPINLGSGREISIGDLATLVASITGYRGRFVWHTDRPNGQPRRALEVSRAKEQLGFVAATSLEIGLRETVRWYAQHQESTK